MPQRHLVLIVLVVLFALRVAAQLVQAGREMSVLPAFDSWQSGAVPYPALLAAQVATLAVQIWVIRRIGAGRFRPPEWVRTVLSVAGYAYFGFMAARLIGGLTVLDGHAWFDAPLPSVFHLVLASFVIVTASAGSLDGGDPR